MSSSARRPALRSAGWLSCAVVFAVAVSPGLAQTAMDGRGWSGPPEAPKEAQAVKPFSERLGIELDEVAPIVPLPALDINALLAEDAAVAAGGDKVLRYGVSRPQVVVWGDGRVEALPDGRRLWALDIEGDACAGLRLHFGQLDLPAGAELIVYGLEDRQVFGPYVETGPLDDGQFWSPHLWGARARVECLLPALKPGAPEPPAPFVIDDIHHLYRNPLTGQIAGQADLDPRGECHNDVTCYPAWGNEAAACAGIGFISGSASLYCSGTMLNAQNGDLSPYWLTANHCLSTNSEAQSSEIFWLYQTASCGGSPPALSSVPRSAICTLLATGTPSDFTLLMVEGTVPRTQIYWSGWQAGGIADGTASTGIHHPAGTFKKISFGTKSSDLGCGGGDHVRVNWFDGPTEPGSSGSGIFDANHRLFGQLHCGPSGCGAVTNDQYGDLGTSYGSISGVLAGGSDDGFESNDSCAGEIALGSSGFAGGLIVKSVDEDWYSFFVPSGQTLSVNASFTHAFGDLDFELFAGCGGVQVASSTGVSNTEAINFTNTGAGATFFLRVHLFSDTRNAYNLSWSTLAPNNGCGGAQFLSGDGTFAFDNTNNSTDGVDDPLCFAFGSAGISNDLWYCWEATVTGIATASTCGQTTIDTRIAVYDGCTCVTGNGIIACADDSCSTQTSLSWNVVANNRYLIRLGNYPGAAPGSGTFTISTVVPPPPNDDCSLAIPVGAGDSVSGTLAGATNDGAASCGLSETSADAWYYFIAPAAGTLTVTTCGTHDAGGVDTGMDTVLSLHSNCGGVELACDDDWPAGVPGACAASDAGLPRDSAISRAMVAGELVLIRVSSFAGSVQDGLFILSVDFDAVNDSCAGAVEVFPGWFVVGDLDSATNDGSASCGSSESNADLWYVFTAPTHGILHAGTCGTHDAGGVDTGMDTVLSVHAGCPGSIADELACNDDWLFGSDPGACSGGDAGSARDSSVALPMSAGQTVYLRVSHFGAVDRDGAFFLSIIFTLADSCDQAVPIACGDTVVGDTTGYGADTAGPCEAAFDGSGGGVWYSLAGTGAPIVLTTCNPGTAYDTMIRVYTDSCGALACVAGNDDGSPLGINPDPACVVPSTGSPANRASTVSFDSALGQTYRVLVSGFGGDQGPFVMTVACEPTCPCELDGVPGVNVFDLLAYLDLWFASDAGADVDGAPGVNVFDLLFYLDCWFPASAGGCP